MNGRAHGFTLIELMVVVVLMGVLLATVAVTAFPDDRSKLRTEADRIAQLWTIANDEAQVRGAAVVWEADPQAFRFLVRDGQTLVPIERDNALRQRAWDLAPMQVSRLDVPGDSTAAQRVVRLAFARAAAQEPVAVELRFNAARAIVRGDGLGNFSVEMP